MTDGFYRLKQIIPDILPISRSSFLRKVKDGEYPQPVRLGKRTVAPREIKQLLDPKETRKYCVITK